MASKEKTQEDLLKKKQEEIEKTWEKINDYRIILWQYLESFHNELFPEYKRNLIIRKNSLEKNLKKKPSKKGEKLLKKIRRIIHFLTRYMEFYKNRIQPIFRTEKSFFKFFFINWDEHKTIRYFIPLEEALKNMVSLKKDKNLPKLDTEIIKKALKDLKILPRKMIEYEKLRKEYGKLKKTK